MIQVSPKKKKKVWVHIFNVHKKLYILYKKHTPYSSFTDMPIKGPVIFSMCKHFKCRCCCMSLLLYDLSVTHIEK